MSKRILAKLSYANVVATIALFVALGGSSYAVAQISGRDIRDNSIRGRDIAADSLTGHNIAEARLGPVPQARVASRLTRRSRRSLTLRCPDGTTLAAGLCFEASPHPALTYDEAMGSCSATNAGNRRLPTAAELVAFSSAGGRITLGGELTSSVFESRAVPGRLDVVIIKNELGDSTFAPAEPLDGSGGGSVRLPFRCVIPPTNVP